MRQAVQKLRRPAAIGLCLGLSGLGACSTIGGDSPLPAPVTASTSSAPLPKPGLDWFFHQTEPDATLAYGVANSDDVSLGLSCRAGTGDLWLWRDTQAQDTRELYLESGGDTERYPAETEPSAMTGGVFLSATARTSDPVMQRFRRTGWIALHEDGVRDVLVAHPENQTGIESFFAVCD